MYSAIDIAKYIIQYCRKHAYYISNLKLQKILYFVQAQFLVETGKPCFYEDIEAWDFGPVVPAVYHEYKYFGSSSIIDENPPTVCFTKIEKELMNAIIEECSNYSASDLVELTHDQSPWKDAYQKYHNNVISNDAIRRFFED